MHRLMLLTTVAFLAVSSNAQAQTDLTAYADANGYLDVQKLTCAQLANTWQEDADKLMLWYSGWYNGLGKKHLQRFARSPARARGHRILQSQTEHPCHRRDRRDLQG
jgi:HdeA/HdeB family